MSFFCLFSVMTTTSSSFETAPSTTTNEAGQTTSTIITHNKTMPFGKKSSIQLDETVFTDSKKQLDPSSTVIAFVYCTGKSAELPTSEQMDLIKDSYFLLTKQCSGAVSMMRTFGEAVAFEGNPYLIIV